MKKIETKMGNLYEERTDEFIYLYDSNQNYLDKWEKSSFDNNIQINKWIERIAQNEAVSDLFSFLGIPIIKIVTGRKRAEEYAKENDWEFPNEWINQVGEKYIFINSSIYC